VRAAPAAGTGWQRPPDTAGQLASTSGSGKKTLRRIIGSVVAAAALSLFAVLVGGFDKYLLLALAAGILIFTAAKSLFRTPAASEVKDHPPGESWVCANNHYNGPDRITCKKCKVARVAGRRPPKYSPLRSDSEKKPPIRAWLIVLGAIMGCVALFIGSKLAGGGSGSSKSSTLASGSRYPTYDAPVPASIPPSTDDDWKAAVCQPGTYSDRKATLPNADWSGFCQSLRGNPIIMGWFIGTFSIQNDLARFRGATFAQLPTSEGRTAVFLTPVGGTGAALDPLTQFGFTLGDVP